MVEFKELFPDYAAYSNDSYLMNTVTTSLLREIAQKLPRVYQQLKFDTPNLILDGTMRNACDIVSLYTNNDKTNHWGFEYIVRDFDSQVRDFEHVKFHKFMDAMRDLGKSDVILKALNSIFEDHDFGYRLSDDSTNPWICINPSIGMSVDFEEVILTTSEICQQTAEHIKQAREQLTRADEPRARKDAIRDCLSAMEALMTYLTGTPDIPEADKVMRADTEKWGQGFIVKDGVTLWKMFHNDYKDIRHGNNFDISKISYDEAIYFVDKLLAYVKYLSARALGESSKEEKLIF